MGCCVSQYSYSVSTQSNNSIRPWSITLSITSTTRWNLVKWREYQQQSQRRKLKVLSTSFFEPRLCSTGTCLLRTCLQERMNQHFSYMQRKCKPDMLVLMLVQPGMLHWRSSGTRLTKNFGMVKPRNSLVTSTHMRPHVSLYLPHHSWLDLSSNQQHFPFLMAKLLDNVCSGGHLGSALLMLSYVYCDAHDGINYGMWVTFVQTLSTRHSLVNCSIYLGFDSYVKSDIKHELDDNQEFASKWMCHADRLLPHMWLDCIARSFLMHDTRQTHHFKYSYCSGQWWSSDISNHQPDVRSEWPPATVEYPWGIFQDTLVLVFVSSDEWTGV